MNTQNLVMHAGDHIKRLMKERKISTKAMASVCGVTPGAVSQWFSTGKISKESAIKAADLLRLDLAALLDGEVVDIADKPKTPSPEAMKLAEWFDLVKGERSRFRAYQAAMQAIADHLPGSDDNAVPPTGTHTLAAPAKRQRAKSP